VKQQITQLLERKSHLTTVQQEVFSRKPTFSKQQMRKTVTQLLQTL
jgi:hypothetical protein